ncbi:PKD domain-containing protein [Tenacibaculum sp. SDUM215027]|uniref:PKD domain-containing protein n=1 Tax=Tenacibaculum sp. SDUM215027 TaxID=3422596 RepID=UPI003D315923
METTNLKLKEITTEYSKFNANQVLTETQLNTFIDYFDDQNRLSRLGLSGVGIACGFGVTPKFTIDKTAVSSIEITQGTAVTTDGDLVQFFDLIEENLQSKTFSFYKKFEDTDGNYERFKNAQDKQYNLWELHSEEDESYTSLVEFPEIQKMAVLLYLEQYPNEDVLCNKLTCDNQGIEQINNLRVLLVSIEDLEAIAAKDAIFLKHNWYKINNELPVVEAKRVVLNTNNTKTFSALKAQFDTVVKDASISVDLIEGYEAIFSKFQKPSIAAKIKALFSFSSLAVPLDFQYRYDVIKDLVDTYNEIKELLLHVNVNCCPDIGAFPKHIMLGKLKKETEYPELRHRFYKSTIVGHENENLQKLQLLIDRAITLASNYIGKAKSGDVVITPSQAHTSLSEKAVPFYYNVSSQLLNRWDFNKTKNYRANQNLSYHKENLANSGAIQKPLSYNIDKNNFYRIEGHQGKMYREALAKILKLKEDNGLSFDVKTLSINAAEQTININNYECEFEDLKMLLSAWRAEQNCILSEVSKTFSAFKLTDPKVNTVVDNVVNYKDKISVLEKEPIKEEIPLVKEYISRMDLLSKEVSVKEDVTNKYNVINQEYIKYFEEENIVKESLTKEEDSLGFLIEKVFDENKGGSSSDIIIELNKETEILKEKEVWKEEPTLSDFILTDLTETLVHAYVLDTKIPLNIRDIDSLVLTSYKLTIAELCKKVKNLQAKYNSTTLELSTKQILGLLINQLSIVCCSGKKLETLLAEIDKRKKKILERIQLSEFVKQHPGLEHKAGVIPGGTFVMVYVTENAADKNTFEDVVFDVVFKNQPITSDKELGVKSEFINSKDLVFSKDEIINRNGGIIKLWDKSSTIEFSFVDGSYFNIKDRLFFDQDVVLVGKTLAETVSNFSAFLNRTWSRAGMSKVLNAEETVMYKDGSVGMRITIQDRLVPKGEYFFQVYNPVVLETNKRLYFDENEVISENETLKNTVVADFSLPYMCCSDCAPVNFIIPKEPPFLSLPVSTICLKKDIEMDPLIFTVRPIDGEVKANVPEGVESGVYLDPEDEKWKIDVIKIDKSLLGKSIKFMVNDEPTDCELIVYPALELLVEVEQPIEYNEDKSKARVTYVLYWKDADFVGADFFNNIKYFWDFKGDGTKVERTPINNKVFENYTLLIDDIKNEIQPGLEISLGPCKKTIAIKPIVFDTLTPSELAIQPSYCLDLGKEEVARIPFTNINGMITIAGGAIEGVTIENNELVVDVAVFENYGQIIEFLEDGQTTNARIIIHEVKQISISERSESRFIWKDGQLFYEAAFEAILPEGVKPEGLKFNWSVNSIESEIELFNPQLLVKEGVENSYTVKLMITDGNGCSSSADFTKIISFPDFTINVPTTFCLSDKEPYPVTVRPQFEGVQLTGGNVKFNEETKLWGFVPANSGLTDSGTVSISLVGTFVTQTINLTATPQASFTHSFNPETRILSLTNTSEKGDKYVWVINGVEREPQINRTTITEDLSNFDGDLVKVSLTVASKCGENTSTEVIEIGKIQDETCEEITKTEVDNYYKLNKFSINDGGSGTNVNMTVIVPTNDVYAKIIDDESNSYLTGENNNQLTELFLGLLNNTWMLSLHDTDNRTLLVKYYKAQVRLFFNILHCQKQTVLESDEIKQDIQDLLIEINTGFTEGQIKKEEALLEFLRKCSVEIQAEYISKFIKENLIQTV